MAVNVQILQTSDPEHPIVSLTCLECGEKVDFFCRTGERCHCKKCILSKGCWLKRDRDFLQKDCYFDFFDEEDGFVTSIKTNEFQTNELFQDLDLVEELKQIFVVRKLDFTTYYGILADEIFKRVKKYVSHFYFRNYEQFFTIDHVNITFNIEDVHKWGKGKLLHEIGRARALHYIGWPSARLRNYKIWENELQREAGR